MVSKPGSGRRRGRGKKEGKGAESLRLQPEQIEDLLLRGEVEEGDLVLHGSNYTFVVRLRAGEFGFYAVYKPASGERPLWDFPYGTLHKRERCTFLVSQALGWGLVPPTVIRDGPHGEGSMQMFVSHNGKTNCFTLREENRAELVLVAVLDLLVNNTDRKGGHCFLGADQQVWAIDHGLTFHAEPKLRTVIWDYSDERLPDAQVADIERLEAALADVGGPLRGEMDALLDPLEVDVFHRRVRAFLGDPRLPHPEECRSFPWPPV